MQDYEDTYLRNRVQAISAKQKEGLIIVLAYDDGTGLPTIRSLPEMRPARFPDDFAAEYGVLRRETSIQGNAYTFHLKPGAKLPAILANYKPLEAGEAQIDASRRLATIQVGQTGITFTDVAVWESGYDLLREINKEFARVNSGVVVWKITSLKEEASPSIRLFPGAVPTLQNGQTRVDLTGIAYDEDRNLVYIGAMGYKTSLESIRASLLTNKGMTMSEFGERDLYLNPLDRYEQVWQAMTEYTSHHAAFLSRKAIPGRWEPEDLFGYALVFAGVKDLDNELHRCFISKLKETLTIPILDEWAESIWHKADELRYIQDLITKGDCLAGIRINLQANWQELIEDLLKQKAIRL